MSGWVLAGIAWVAVYAALAWRPWDRTSLDDHPADAPAPAPLVSVVVPARDEARNVGRCVRSILASTWPNLELIVVDDHSTDGTGDVARAAARREDGTADPRLRVVSPPPLPSDWFGKQWACHAGAGAARGEYLCFTDADTRHGPELLVRSVNAMIARRAALLSVAGTQELGSFWEKVIQPFVFATLVMRYGGMERMSRATRPHDKILNGQFILVRRADYDAEGGHAAVKAHVAEDLRLAQRWTARGRSVQMVWGPDHLATRMYTSFGELRRGWGKNVFAAGRDAVGDARVARLLFPVLLPLSALIPLVPLVVAGLALAGVLASGALAFAAIATAGMLAFWMLMYGGAGISPLWGLSFPLASAAFAWICAEAAWRGSRVEWKGRRYVSRSE